MASNNYQFDLNEIPNIEGVNEIQYQNEERDEDRQAVVPLVVRSSVDGTLVLDLNTDENRHYPVIDLNVDYLQLDANDDSDIEDTDSILNEGEDADSVLDAGDDTDSFLNVGDDTDSVFNAGNVDVSHEDATVREKKFLSNEQRWAIYTALLEKSVNGKLKRTTTNKVATLFSVSLRTVQRIWKRAKDTPHGTNVNVSQKKTKNCGRKRVQVDLNKIIDVPLHKRTTLRSLASAPNMNHNTLFKLLKEGLIQRHSNAIKPHLKDHHKRARLQFCLSMIDHTSLPHEPKFIDMYNIVHIDEKWFYMSKKTEKYYLLPVEEDPLRQCQSSHYIGKVMFLVAMGRPKFDNEGNEIFSGKIGIWPFVTREPALRRSVNREAGTLVTKSITSVNRDINRKWLIEKVIPKIQSCWPREELGSVIFIQQDNTRSHVDPNDEDVIRVSTQNGFNIRLMCQSANSPDLNILDLGFFSAIQSLQQKVRANSVDELIEAVKKSFDEYPTKKVEYVWLTLQLCMREILKVEGSNRYKIPHVNKARLDREGLLPTQIVCDPIAIQNVRNQLQL